MTDSTIEQLDRIPFLPIDNKVDLIAPTVGTQAQRQLVCNDQLTELQQLAAKAEEYYTVFKSEVDLAASVNDLLTTIASSIFNFNNTRINNARSIGSRMMDEVKTLCDAARPEKLMVNIPKTNFDYGAATPAVIKFMASLSEIVVLAAKIKLEARITMQNVRLTTLTEQKEKLANYNMTKYEYDIEMYLITPGGQKYNIDQYIDDMLYTRLFDESSLPIYSVLFKFPQTLVSVIKKHGNKNKWFITIKAFEKQFENTANNFKIAQVVVQDTQLIPVDPKYSTPNTDADRADQAVAVYPFKIDLVPHKDTTLNAKVKARVFTNVRLVDVIGVLCDELAKEYAARNEDSNKNVKFSIAPPDNLTTYEQILVEPGSFTKAIEGLQKKYGIYYTGVRVSFDSIQTERTGGGVENSTQVTVLGKGDAAPTKDSVKDVYIELVDPRQVQDPAFDTGMYIDQPTGIAVLRTFLPYIANMNNSDSLINGESVRVMQSSIDDHYISNCDNEPTDVTMSKMYWSNYNNPYALTQLQDSIREKEILVQAEFRDLNSIMFTDNLSYQLKFFGEDDKIYTGNYRITSLRMYIRGRGKAKNYSRVETSTIMTFAVIPPLRINGVEVPRESYGEKLTKNAAARGTSFFGAGKPKDILDKFFKKTTPVTAPAGASSSSTTFNSAIGGRVDPSYGRPEGSTAPFTTNFPLQKDFYGLPVPPQIPSMWMMSTTTMLKDLYDTNQGTSEDLGYVICNNYNYFINAQRFAKELIDPCIKMFGMKGKNNKFDSWYRYSIAETGGTSSQHLVAMAVDSTWGMVNTEDDLTKRFLDLINSNVDFDQMVLQGNGSGWEYIHLSKNMNGTNRREAKLSFDKIGGRYRSLNMGLVQSNADIRYKAALRVCM